MSSVSSWRGQFKERARAVVKNIWHLDILEASAAAQKAQRLCEASLFIYQDEVSPNIGYQHDLTSVTEILQALSTPVSFSSHGRLPYSPYDWDITAVWGALSGGPRFHNAKAHFYRICSHGGETDALTG